MAATTLSSITASLPALSNVLLVSPQQTVGYQPQSTQGGIPAFLFHYEGEQTATLDCDITDHWIEDNTTIQDQIAIKPFVITTHGFIGELNNVAPFGLQTLQVIANKLVSINSYLPGLSATALLAYNTAFAAYQTAQNALNTATASAASLGNAISGSNSGGENVINGVDITDLGGQNKQQTFFQQFSQYQLSRTLFTIQTPWAVFENMAIKTFRAVQSEETVVITDFELTFKQMRFAQTLTVTADVDSAGRLFSQSATITQLGTAALSNSVPFDPATGASA